VTRPGKAMDMKDGQEKKRRKIDVLKMEHHTPGA
jgi:hypothetical protein